MSKWLLSPTEKWALNEGSADRKLVEVRSTYPAVLLSSGEERSRAVPSFKRYGTDFPHCCKTLSAVPRPKSQEVLRQGASETGLSRCRRTAQSGAHSKKPRMMRGSERLITRLSELEGLVLAGHTGFGTTVRSAV